MNLENVESDHWINLSNLFTYSYYFFKLNCLDCFILIYFVISTITFIPTILKLIVLIAKYSKFYLSRSNIIRVWLHDCGWYWYLLWRPFSLVLITEVFEFLVNIFPTFLWQFSFWVFHLGGAPRYPIAQQLHWAFVVQSVFVFEREDAWFSDLRLTFSPWPFSFPRWSVHQP